MATQRDLDAALSEACRTTKTTIRLHDEDWRELFSFQSFRFGENYTRIMELLPQATFVRAYGPYHSATASGLLPGRLQPHGTS